MVRLYHAHGLELEAAGVTSRGGRARRGAKKMTKSTGVGGKRLGWAFPFNLLINHANEILTGYSEAFLGGAVEGISA